MFGTIAAEAGAARRHGHLAWWVGIAVGLGGFAGLGGAMPALADSRPPADTEVVGYAAADRSGASLSWILPDGAPYLFVPSIGGAVGDSVAAVDTGAGVGAVLFPRPYFGTHDTGCAPQLGSDTRSDLKWRGATARFAPPVEAPSEPASGQSAGVAAERISSLIVYRKNLGPPPGALFLDRRLTIGLKCSRAVHMTFFDRIFVPIAAPPEPARCFNLAGTYPRPGGQDFKVDFASADRLVLLQPADVDDGYRGIRHRFRVTLYDGEGCRGDGGEFRSAGPEPGDIKLDQMGLRDRVRSLKIVYEGGPLAPYYVAPAAAPVASKEPAVPPPAAEAAPKQAAAPAAAPTATPPTPATPAPSTPAPATSPAAAPPTAASVKALADDVVAGPPSTPRTLDAPVAAPRPAPVPLQVAMPPPRLELPAAKAVVPSPAAASKTFEYPVYEIYRLNYCLRWGADCGEPAATAWCRAQGFAKASAWQVDKNIGSLFPTIVLTEKRICAQFPCDGFEQITCSN